MEVLSRNKLKSNLRFFLPYCVGRHLGKSTTAWKSDLRNAAFVGSPGATYVEATVSNFHVSMDLP
jgi:hypothetical protein